MTDLETILQNGGAVILPTETVYGLFAQAMNEKAVEHVYQLKRRYQQLVLEFPITHKP